jgi:CDP-diacylglycerol---glycerol-3-phosphate 3-phosphatidyltransferase
MSGLYALKPWFAGRLSPMTERLAAHGVSADAVSSAGVVFAAAGGAVLAFAQPGPGAGVVLAGLLTARLACANIDGTLARRQRPRAFGRVVNELGDRLADLAAVAGLATHLGWAAGAVALAATLPSWAALAIAAAGGRRINGGPVGKTERCVLLICAAATGYYVAAGIAIVAGSVLTTILRLIEGARTLRTEDGR